jgi:hypothetical protein
VALSETIRSVIHSFLKSRDRNPLGADLIDDILLEDDDIAAFSTVVYGARSPYRLILMAEKEEKGHFLNLIAELLDPKSLVDEIKDGEADFFTAMVERLNEALPGVPFVFDANHPSLLCSVQVDGQLSEEAITENLLKDLHAAIYYLVRQYEKHYDTLLLEKVRAPYPEGFKCKQCGHCCMNLNAHYMSVPQEDVDRWHEAGRHDILEWVASIPVGDGEFMNDIWISPTTGEEARRCPWLRKLPRKDQYICRIQDLKPTVCRVFPQSRKHAEKCGCKGFDDTAWT